MEIKIQLRGSFAGVGRTWVRSPDQINPPFSPFPRGGSQGFAWGPRTPRISVKSKGTCNLLSLEVRWRHNKVTDFSPNIKLWLILGYHGQLYSRSNWSPVMTRSSSTVLPFGSFSRLILFVSVYNYFFNFCMLRCFPSAFIYWEIVLISGHHTYVSLWRQNFLHIHSLPSPRDFNYSTAQE